MRPAKIGRNDTALTFYRMQHPGDKSSTICATLRLEDFCVVFLTSLDFKFQLPVQLSWKCLIIFSVQECRHWNASRVSCYQRTVTSAWIMWGTWKGLLFYHMTQLFVREYKQLLKLISRVWTFLLLEFLCFIKTHSLVRLHTLFPWLMLNIQYTLALRNVYQIDWRSWNTYLIFTVFNPHILCTVSQVIPIWSANFVFLNLKNVFTGIMFLSLVPSISILHICYTM